MSLWLTQHSLRLDDMFLEYNAPCKNTHTLKTHFFFSQYHSDEHSVFVIKPQSNQVLHPNILNPRIIHNKNGTIWTFLDATENDAKAFITSLNKHWRSLYKVKGAYLNILLPRLSFFTQIFAYYSRKICRHFGLDCSPTFPCKNINFIEDSPLKCFMTCSWFVMIELQLTGQ